MECVIDRKLSLSALEIEEPDCKESGEEMAKKSNEITEELLRLHAEKFSLLEKSMINNTTRVESSAEQDKLHMTFFETLHPTLRQVSTEDILLCRNDVSKVIFKYAYKNAPRTSISDSAVNSCHKVPSTPAPPKRRKQAISEDDRTNNNIL